MPLTPADVRNKQFSTTRLRPGYDEEEVDAFLDEVEAELDRLIQENEELRAKLAECLRGKVPAMAAPIVEPKPEIQKIPEPPRPEPQQQMPPPQPPQQQPEPEPALGGLGMAAAPCRGSPRPPGGPGRASRRPRGARRRSPGRRSAGRERARGRRCPCCPHRSAHPCRGRPWAPARA